MIVFLYLLAAMGVGYWAKIHGRNTALWFALAVVLTPLGAGIAMAFADRWFSPSSR
jgi:hypothetical protein